MDLAVQEIRLPLIAQALIKKQSEGIRVRVILENNYHDTIQDLKLRNGGSEHSMGKFEDLFAFADINKNGVLEHDELVRRDAIYMLKNANVNLKDDTADGSAGSGIMHHKFAVIDGKTVIASTANFTLSGIHGDYLKPKSRGNANSLLVIQSESSAKSFTEEFEIMWGSANDVSRFGTQKPYRKSRSVSLSSRKSLLTLQFSPTSQRLSWDDSVNGLIGKTISKAKTGVRMALFVFSDQKITDILQAKRSANADLKIGLVIEPNFAFRYYSETLDMWGLMMLDPWCQYGYEENPWSEPLGDEIGISNLEDGDVMHHKFAVVDNDTVIVGSQNWSVSANHKNDENIIVVKDKTIASAYLKEFNRIYKTSSKGIPRFLLDRIDRVQRECSAQSPLGRR